MQRPTKQWIYAGLLLVAGVGVARLMTAPRIKRGMKVLLIGDSLAVGMAPHFAALAKEAGVEFKVLAKVGTTITAWASNAELAQLLASYQPGLVLVSLGTNDAYIKGAGAATDQRAQLDKLLQLLKPYRLDGPSYLGPEHIVWIGPPTLPAAANPAMAQMIRDGAGSGLSPRYHYFHSERLEIPRGPDGIHPTARGYAGWAGAIWHWLS